MRHRQARLLTLTSSEERALREWLVAHPEGTRLALRALILLTSARTSSVFGVARQLGCTRVTVQRWLERWESLGLAGLHDQARSGRPRKLGLGTLQAVLDQQKLSSFGGRSCPRAVADVVGVSPSTVRRAMRRITRSRPAEFTAREEPPGLALVGLHISRYDLVFAVQVVTGRLSQTFDESEPRILDLGQLIETLHQISSQLCGEAVQRSPHRARLLSEFLAGFQAQAAAGKQLELVHVGAALPAAYLHHRGGPSAFKVTTLKRNAAWWKRLHSILQQQSSACCCTVESLLALERNASRGLAPSSKWRRTFQWVYAEPCNGPSGSQEACAATLPSWERAQSLAVCTAAGCELHRL